MHSSWLVHEHNNKQSVWTSNKHIVLIYETNKSSCRTHCVCLPLTTNDVILNRSDVTNQNVVWNGMEIDTAIITVWSFYMCKVGLLFHRRQFSWWTSTLHLLFRYALVDWIADKKYTKPTNESISWCQDICCFSINTTKIHVLSFLFCLMFERASLQSFFERTICFQWLCFIIFHGRLSICLYWLTLLRRFRLTCPPSQLQNYNQCRGMAKGEIQNTLHWREKWKNTKNCKNHVFQNKTFF